MNGKYLLLVVMVVSLDNAFAQTTDCNRIPFFKADHIKNPSLEQILTSCEDELTSDYTGATIEMSMVVPFWRLPIKSYGGVGYFAVCNNFYHFIDPVQEADPNSLMVRKPIVPQPIPDGKGVIGLISARTKYGSPVEERLTDKEYISTNLSRTLKKDSLYRLDFAFGFGKKDDVGEAFNISGSPAKYSLYGLKDSTKIPFQKPESPGLLGCLPLHFPDWIELGTVTITGDPGTWQRAIIDFTPPTEIQSIALGPSCDFSNIPYIDRQSPVVWDYYFIDDLKFFQASAPKPRLSKIAGNSCEGESTTLRLQSNDFYNGSSFQWYRNNTPLPETNVSITTSSLTYGPGWYKMRVQNDSVCMMSDSVYLEWAPRIIDPYLGKPDTTLCMGETIELKVSAGTNATYLWSTGSTDSAITVNQTGTYTVRVSNACNTLNAMKTVLYKDCPPSVFVPSAFTPNGDGLNDIFRVTSSGTIKSFSLSVYDRFGQRIFFSDDPSRGWDGKINGKIQNTALFIWMLRYTDGSDKIVSQKGTITLIR